MRTASTTGGSLSWLSPVVLRAVTATLTLVPDGRLLNVASASSGNTDGPACQIPYWVKLVRSSDTFTGYVSADGENWRRVDSVTVPMEKKIYVGLALSAHNNSALNSSLFDNVEVSK